MFELSGWLFGLSGPLALADSAVLLRQHKRALGADACFPRKLPRAARLRFENNKTAVPKSQRQSQTRNRATARVQPSQGRQQCLPRSSLVSRVGGGYPAPAA